jgi:prevent-host-death family protein
MPPAITQTDSLTNFTSDPKRFLERLRESGLPVVLTDAGEPQVVVQDAASYQRFRELVDQLETIAAVKESLHDEAAGRVYPAREALGQLGRELGLPPVDGE